MEATMPGGQTLAIQYRQVRDLIPYARNSRTHSDEQVAQIAGSIREFGWTNPVLIDGDAGIIAGHGRVLAAQRLGLKEVPTIQLDHMTEAQRRAYVIADNKLALNAGWDDDALRVELRDLTESHFDITLTGFDEREIANLLISENFAPGTADDQGRLDQLEPKMVICPNCHTEFDSREA
jgi:ParB-like chromosome segregation protein Spo0J